MKKSEVVTNILCKLYEWTARRFWRRPSRRLDRQLKRLGNILHDRYDMTWMEIETIDVYAAK